MVESPAFQHYQEITNLSSPILRGYCAPKSLVDPTQHPAGIHLRSIAHGLPDSVQPKVQTYVDNLCQAIGWKIDRHRQETFPGEKHAPWAIGRVVIKRTSFVGPEIVTGKLTSLVMRASAPDELGGAMPKPPRTASKNVTVYDKAAAYFMLSGEATLGSTHASVGCVLRMVPRVEVLMQRTDGQTRPIAERSRFSAATYPVRPHLARKMWELIQVDARALEATHKLRPYRG